MPTIEQLGWTDKLREIAKQRYLDPHSRPARVIAEHRNGIVIDDGIREQFLTSQGRWFHGSNEQRPIVGDWVLLSAKNGRVERLLERKNTLQRALHQSASPQAIASNIDIMFIVFSCDGAFTESRLERYLALGEISDVEVVVVLTKIDLLNDYQTYVERARSLTFKTPVIPVNALKRSFLDEIVSLLTGTQTGILVGASGVGKSTLINTIAGSEVQHTQPVRARDSKGRHTTTVRNLIRLPFGGLVIDVPGTRKLQLPFSPKRLPRSFPDVEAVIQSCRFSNCRHTSEPGCAVQDALQCGTFDERRLRNYLSLVA